LQSASTLQTASALPHVVLISALRMHRMHSRVGVKGPQLVIAHGAEQLLQAQSPMIS
jgi:hypothetical protein